ncbi:MAG: hypothetical protein IJZ37_02490 [Clostridia bacterium]|nr:hypothetical protein [Clostridia bacterium]
MNKKEIRGGAIEKWKVAAFVMALVILILGGATLGFYLSGFRYLQVNYLLAPENVQERISFMGFVNKDGSIKDGNITGVDGKKGEVSIMEDGKYTIRYNNGDVYVGALDGLQRSGKGMMTYASGDVYEGEFYADRLHGKGVFKYASGDSYEGTFSGGKKSGEGIYVWVDEEGNELARYEGSFALDKRNGYGEFTAADGTVYKGNFVNDQRSDKQAQVLIPTEEGTDRYYGGYEGDVRAGFGYYFYASGDVYIGEFENNKPHGQGVIRFAEGGAYKGTFKNGNIVKDDAEKIPSSEVDDLLSGFESEEPTPEPTPSPDPTPRPDVSTEPTEDNEESAGEEPVESPQAA